MGKSNMVEVLSSLVPSLISTQALFILQVLPRRGNAVPSLKLVTEITASPVLNLDIR